MITVTACIITGREMVKRAMYATMGREYVGDTVSDATMLALLKPRHSPIEEYRFWFDLIVPERSHTHIVRHEEIGKYVASSRPDLAYCTPIADGHRQMSLSIDAKRLIEIMMQRLCFKAWGETKEVFVAMRNAVIQLDPVFSAVLVPQCVWYGFCPEHSAKRPGCGYNKSLAFEKERGALVKE